MDINAQHKAVARMMALGFPLREICEVYRLEYGRWKAVVEQALFQQEIARVQTELEQRMLDDASGDPVVLRLKQGAERAAQRLVEEIDSVDETANASTRIKAAVSLLDRLGYTTKKEENQSNVVFVTLTNDKLDAVLGERPLAAQPENVSA